ncbi:PD-(D/E)XK nuclease family protein [bacterium]|nr:PD-(D/E)XK nuclease family protein [bacterium]
MGKIIEIPFSCNLIEFVTGELLKKEEHDFSNAAVVFPHHRPALYLRQAILKKLGQPFFPPQVFSMDEFMAFLAEKVSPNLTLTNSLDSIYLLFQTARDMPDNPWQKSDSFTQFLPWGLKLEKVIQELDTEMVSDEKLSGIALGDLWEENVAKHAALLMNHLTRIRQAYHTLLKGQRLTSRGRNYSVAAKNIKELDLSCFKAIYFAGLFALTKAEKIVIRHLLREPETKLIRQNDGTKWGPFEEMDGWAEGIEHRAQSTEHRKQAPEIFLHSAFNTHSEVVGLRDILTANPQPRFRNPQSVAIVLPEPEPLIPLLSEVMTTLSVDYNITMGYPAIRTPIYALLDLILRLFETKREDAYYLPDYLSLLMHPYIKNIHHKIESSQMRILIHSIEETLCCQGKMFLELSEIEEKEEIFIQAARMTREQAPFKDVLAELHFSFIRKMEAVKTLAQLGSFFEGVLTFLLKFSPAVHYPFSGEFFASFFSLLDRIKDSLIKDEKFKDPKELFGLFRHLARQEHIPFKGVPLKGLQILGLLETRGLNFEEVFLLSANEEILPAVKTFDSLLPLPLRAALDMPLHYQNEEIYAYHFHHLISQAKKVHIFYQQTEKQTRSRFVEKLVWEKEKEAGELDALKAGAIQLDVSLRPQLKFETAKTEAVLDVLRRINYSATGLNTYLKCPAGFYFGQVLGLKERERAQDELDAAGVGNILHQVMEKLYQPFAGKGILGKREFDHLEKNLKATLENVFRENFGQIRGEPYLLKEMAISRLSRYVEKEKKNAGKISIISTEEDLSCLLKLRDGAVVRLTGRADRVDKIEEEYMITDYKSGKNLEGHSFNAFDQVFSRREEMKGAVQSLQLPFYILLYQRTHSIAHHRINSKLISLATTKERPLFKKEMDRKEFLEEVFLPSIKNLIGEILNPDIPFVRDEKSSTCQYCPFPVFCRK